MTRYALTLSYNGSPFFGWQKQTAGIPTVQAALERALAQIAGHPVAVTAAGRTDTGVHATAQVVHFDSDARRPLTAWVRGVNAFLPDSIAVLHAQETAPDFHARFDAFGRRYRYLLQSSPVRSPLLAGRAGWTHYPLDTGKMRTAATLLVGEHDFSSFRAAECQAKSPVKTLYRIGFSGSLGLIKIDFHANAFLHHMVRNIVGALSVDGFADIFAAQSRLNAPPTFMADGLYFAGADYPPEWGILRLDTPEWL